MKNRFLMRSTLACLVFALVLSFLTVFIGASEDDYSYPSATFSENIYADEFLEDYVPGIDLSEAERDFLRLQSGFLFAYNSKIPTSVITTQYENERLTVTACEYTYVAANGITVVWKPTFATVGDTTKAFTSSPYVLEFSGVSTEDGDTLGVKYSAEFVISADTVNKLLNMAYDEAPKLEADLNAKRDEYILKHEEYLVNSRLYNEYLAALALYNEYLSAKRLYDEENAKYQKYLLELKEYQQLKIEYNNYVIAREKYYRDLAEYTKYLAYAEQNQAKIEAYEKYEEKIKVVNLQLDIIDKTKTQITSLNRSVYSAIMGNTVTSVIENKGDIVSLLGANAKVVDMAGVATQNLRSLLTEYFDIRSKQEKYQYYIANYEAFRDNFVNLLKALDNLYLVSGVRGAMIAEDKHEKYLILVAQLYYVANALSDTPIKSYDGKYYFDSSYKIGSTYSSDKQHKPSNVLENAVYITDTNNAAPLEDGYPIAPEKPTYTTMTEPVMPKPVKPAIAPEPVDKPTEPTPVPKPDVVLKPGEEPQPYEAPAEVLAVIEAYKKGEITERAEYTGGNISVTRVIEVEKKFLNETSVTVTYYNKEYNAGGDCSVLYTVTVDRGTYADYLGPVPKKDEDAHFVYTHCGWTDENGLDIALDSISESVSVYPKFSSLEKHYETRWFINGEEFFDNPGTPPLPTDGYFYFDFSGWERTVDSSGSNIIYTAIFDKPLVKAAGTAAKVSIENGKYLVEPDVVATAFDISVLLERAAGASGIVIKTVKGEQIDISYTEAIKLKELGASAISFSKVKTARGGYAYTVSVFDGEGSLISDGALSLTFSDEYVTSDEDHTVLYHELDGKKVTVKADLASGRISFSARSGITYYAGVEYTVTSLQLDDVTIETNKTLLGKGDTVYVVITPKPGTRVNRVYYMGQDGVKITVQNNSFTMPGGDVTVGVEYTVELYTVTFIANGKTVVSYLCNYGDVIDVPTAPKKASTEKYSYTFEYWAPQVSCVTGNATYIAIYSSAPILSDSDGGAKLSRTGLMLLLLLIFFVGCLFLIVMPASVMTVVLIKKRKKQAFKAPKCKKCE